MRLSSSKASQVTTSGRKNSSPPPESAMAGCSRRALERLDAGLCDPNAEQLALMPEVPAPDVVTAAAAAPGAAARDGFPDVTDATSGAPTPRCAPRRSSSCSFLDARGGWGADMPARLQRRHRARGAGDRAPGWHAAVTRGHAGRPGPLDWIRVPRRARYADARAERRRRRVCRVGPRLLGCRGCRGWWWC